MADTHENIYQKMARIRKGVEVLKKDKAAYNYDYVSDEQILAHITGMMNKLHISLIPEIIPGTAKVTPIHYIKQEFNKVTKQTQDKDVNEIVVEHEMRWHWVNDENPEERIIVPWFSVGQQADASQAFGSGLTYSSRYFKLVYFNVATTKDDPDNWRSKQKEAENQEQREIASAIIAQVDTIVNDHLRIHSEDRDAIMEMIKRYAKDRGKPSANYNLIVDPIAAAQLKKELDELVQSYVSGAVVA